MQVCALLEVIGVLKRRIYMLYEGEDGALTVLDAVEQMKWFHADKNTFVIASLNHTENENTLVKLCLIR